MELLIFIAGYATGVVSVFVAIWAGMRLRDRKPHMTWPDAERHIEEGRAAVLQGDYPGIGVSMATEREAFREDRHAQMVFPPAHTHEERER